MDGGLIDVRLTWSGPDPFHSVAGTYESASWRDFMND